MIRPICILGHESPPDSHAGLGPLPLAWLLFRLLPKAALLLLLLVFFPTRLESQETRIEGQVRLASGEEESGGASVKLYNQHQLLADSTVTDTRGHFYFMGVPLGDYTISVIKPGHVTAAQTVKVTFATPEQYVTVFITPEGVSLKLKASTTVSAAELALPAKTRAWFEKGKKALRKGKYEESIRHLKVVTEAQPDFVLGWEVLGVAHHRASDIAQAEKAFEQALALDPRRAECYIQLGLVNYERGQYRASEKLLARGLDLNPQSWFGHYQLGLTYFALENYEASEKEFARSRDLDPSFSEVHVRLGNLYLRRQNPAKALAEFEDYLRQDPKGRFGVRVRQVVNEMRAAGIVPPS